ncbi:MAG TPA: hypothetical protein VGB55_07060 [Tepidisphaeraceae bacterium]|jgi:hypothetical protein
MTYHGKVTGGVVVLDGDKPAEGTAVAVIPSTPSPLSIAAHPAIGLWKDRTDLSNDAAEASVALRKKLMQRSEERPQ